MNRVFIYFLVVITLSGCRLFEKEEDNGPLPAEPYITAVITSPSAGELINRGRVLSIRWNGVKFEKIHIELWKKKQYYNQVIIRNSVNEGVYNWVVPHETPSSTYYQIKIIDAASQDDFIYSEVFSIK